MNFPMTDLPLLYTIGHSDRTLEVLVDDLRRCGVRMLVDVRSAPYSRYVPQFNRELIEPFLRDHGLEYRYAGETLGGRPKDESVYRDGALPAEDHARSDYLDIVQYDAIMAREWYQRGITRLLQLMSQQAAQNEYVAVMCSEGNPRECHRHHLIARSLIDPAVRIIGTSLDVAHILRDGSIERLHPLDFEAPPQQIALF